MPRTNTSVLWRAARFYFWASERSGRVEGAAIALGEGRLRDMAEKAISLNPNDVAGYYWAA